MKRIVVMSFIVSSLLYPSIASADFKVAEFTFLPNKSKSVINIKSTVRDSLKEDRSQRKIDQDVKLSDKQIEKLIGNIVFTK